LPFLDTVRVYVLVGAATANVAVTVVAASIVTVQVPVPEHPPPLQPVKVEPVAEVAVRVTGVPLVKLALQATPQSIPAGLEVMLPFPLRTTLKVEAGLAGGTVVNAAVTVVAAFIVTVQGPVPLQPPPLHPVKVEPVAGVAVRVTLVP
jgi:hypothetical protein